MYIKRVILDKVLIINILLKNMHNIIWFEN